LDLEEVVLHQITHQALGEEGVVEEVGVALGEEDVEEVVVVGEALSTLSIHILILYHLVVEIMDMVEAVMFVERRNR